MTSASRVRAGALVGTALLVLSGIANAALISRIGGQAVPESALQKDVPPPTPVGSTLTEMNWFTGGSTELGRQSFESGVTGFAYTGGTASFTGSPVTLIDANSSSVDPLKGRYNTTKDLPPKDPVPPPDLDEGHYIEATSTFSLNFTSAVSALGFFGTDFGDFDGTLELEFFNGGNSLGVLAVSDDTLSGANSNGNLIFFGMVSDTAFNSVTFKITQCATCPGGTDVLGFDDMIVGTKATVVNPTPEPFSLALVGLGLAAAGAASRRKKA